MITPSPPDTVEVLSACLSGRTRAPGDAPKRSALFDELKRRQRKDYIRAAAFVNAYLGFGDKSVDAETSAATRNGAFQCVLRGWRPSLYHAPWVPRHKRNPSAARD